MPKKTWVTSTWVDTSRPDLTSVLKDTGIDCQEFSDWLQPLIEDYRTWNKFKSTNASTERKQIQGYIKALKETIAYVENDGLIPPFAKSELALEAINSGVDPIQSRMALEKLLWQELKFAVGVGKRSGSWMSPKGAPKHERRDKMLTRIVEKLVAHGLTKTDARERAEEILILAKIPVPATTRGQQRAEKRGRP